jgi:WD40 repeat protein
MRSRPIHLLLFFLLIVHRSPAQQSCPAIQLTAPDPSKLLFNPQQEMYLGEVVSEHMQSKFLVVDEDDVTTYLRRVGDRVARQLPKSDLQYQFFLYDQPEIQAFGLPGGRIYISRKMVAFLKNEDELAGLLGHELGHIVMKQQNEGISRQMREILGIQSVGDREDIFEKYNEWMENSRLKKTHSGNRSDSDRDQQIADQVGLEATVRAGYSPQAFVGMMDRLMETKGKTGNWLSDMFGATKPDAKRLREVLKDVASLPPSCIDRQPVGAPAEFTAWQSAVLYYQGIGHKEKLHDIVYRKKLGEPLRSDIENFRFSPDGQYILAQDDSAISVLTREPFRVKFRFDAIGAQPAHFSPDSRQIVFATRDLRVEVWDIENQERASLSDVAAIHGCRESELSPEGKIIACVGNDLALSLFDVNSSQELFHKNPFVEFSNLNYTAFAAYFFKLLRGESLTTLRFSPDGRYFAAAAPGSDGILLELPECKKLNIPGSVQPVLKHSFAFLSPTRLIGLDAFNPQKSPIVDFPTGKVISHVALGGGTLTAGTNPRYLLVRPIVDHAVGALDLDTQKYVFANRNAATDVWSDTTVSERLNGEVALYKVTETKPFATLQLPVSPIGSLAAFAASPDLRWLAASGHSRGAIWDLDKNERLLYTRGYVQVFSVSPEIFYLAFPKYEKAEPELVAFSGASHQSATRTLDEGDDLTLRGKYSVRWKHSEKERDEMRNVTLDIIDTEKGQTLWTRTFPKQAPWLQGVSSNGRLILLWSATSDTAKEEFSRLPALKEKWPHKTLTENDYLLEVVDSLTGKPIGALIVTTGKGAFRIGHAESVGDWVVVSDTSNRVLLYSLATGDTKARFFGAGPSFSPSGTLLCMSNDRGELRLFDLRSLTKVDDLLFANRVVMKAFSSDAKKLLVLTDDQTVYVVDVTNTDSSRNSASAATN